MMIRTACNRCRCKCDAIATVVKATRGSRLHRHSVKFDALKFEPTVQQPIVAFHQSATMASDKIRMADRLKGTDKNVWVEFSKLAVDEKALNLGQGFPDFFPPQYVRDALQSVVSEDDFFLSQYTRSFGHPRLVNALAKLFSPMIGQEINPLEDIVTSVGAYGSLFYAIQGLVNPGDEVVIIEPYFDCYAPMVTTAGGIPVFIPLRSTKSDSSKVSSSADWKLDPGELASKFNSKTKLIIFNNPNNPLGKVYTLDEMRMIADLCKTHDVVCLSDEVYEWMVYKPNVMHKMASLPDMWDRTITVGSAGKTFSATGWKIGWAIGPNRLIKALHTVHQNCVYNCSTALQEAVAIAFEKEQPQLDKPICYFNSLALELEPKRDRMAKFLQEIGIVPIIPEGGYFLIGDVSNLSFPIDVTSDEPKDFQFVKWMTRTKKVTAIPPSAFYSEANKHLAADLVRFCFIKQDSTLDKAEEIFRNWTQRP